MTDDLIESTFSGLDEFYPGSKRKRKAVVKKQPEVVPGTNWDSSSKLRTLPNGKDVEMFTIGALASALGRPIITIRNWIKEGHIPSAPYRLPSTKDVNGDVHAGKRLYSRAIIEKTLQLFEKAGVLETKRIDWAQHRQLSNELAEAWSEIRASELN